VVGVPPVPTGCTRRHSHTVHLSLRTRLRGGSLVAAAVVTAGASGSTCVLSVL